ncbi:Retrovirus-related Pol polyprotein type-1 like protein [Argiope bruennichi]|uniref:Retrovirus-related Pol polyprotein type-1 like protein n=1 Tax=Argiope bruennichi TaxID=94029 RepID=A0A8T0FBI5_ARGBR|nr:Retrovirus-related Pol polyprotein type-1 like protein [Argiope bruennichi]
MLERDIIFREVDCICITEPYLYEEQLVGIPNGYNGIYNSESRTAIIIKNSIKFIPIQIEKDFIAINCSGENSQTIVISIYCSPSEDLHPNLEKLEKTIARFPNYPIIINGDFNAKSPAWGKDKQDERGKNLLGCLNRLDLDIINEIHSPPTFDSTRGRSWIDLTSVKNIARNKIMDWKVHTDISLSDHNLITFSLDSGAKIKVTLKRWSLDSLKILEFRRDLKMLLDSIS